MQSFSANHSFSVHASLSALSPFGHCSLCWPVTDSTSFPKNNKCNPLHSPLALIFYFILQCLAPLFSLTNNITPNSLVNTHTWPKHSPCFPPSKTAASRHWTGPPHLLGEVHPQCGKSCGAGGCSYHKPHWLAHYQWLVCSYNHVTLCCEFFLDL